MTPKKIACLIDAISFKQLLSKKQVDETTYDFELHGRSIVWSIRLSFYSTFPFSLPLVTLLNKEYIGQIPHVNVNGTVCVEEGDTVLIYYHSPKELIEVFLLQTLRTLDRSSLKVFKDELYDELEGFIHGVDTVNSFFRAGQQAEFLTLRIAPSINFLAPYDVYPVAIAKNFSDISSSFSNTQVLSKYQLVKIVHIPLMTPVVPPTSNENSKRFISEIQQQISEENTRTLIELIGDRSKRHRQYFVLLSMPRSDGSRSEFLCQFSSITPEFHPVLEWSADWKIKFFLLNRHNKEYLLERGGARLSLDSKSVAVIGCGSVGGELAMLVAKSGVGRLKLVDGELLDADNIYRHSLGGRYLNFQSSDKDRKVRKHIKVTALAKELSVNLPHINVETFPHALSVESIESVIEGVDLVIVAIGNPSTSLLINSSLKERKFNNVIFCWNEPHSYGGHSVALNLEEACLECVLYGDSDSGSSIHLVEFGQSISKNLTGCAGVFTPFSYLDSTKTATLAAQQAITFLTSGIIAPHVSSWRGSDSGTLQTTSRFKTMSLLEEMTLARRDGCKCCDNRN
ncbi:HesA/MoeB/ThiF family protein [Vibrio tarriae]|uniref:HesA/MoeB/ThiF family protein n=1 Tax=Vibrio tarriae TaxID=2014742 RepID=UPI000DE3F35A|nr:ThiF family adenylyltransferase [Vibrio tarriae]EGR0442571.1 hypothetical protein [Vibrio cholerae]EGR0451261.1 hypothetical protein [Vibrio cholerae]EJL6706109.1 ThiF family adenylyltransferase [Vibrio cholerae]MVB23160.1 hypothetical protein [Vibrio cholerae]MVB51078.1 hypothetical protein [Vibrio cholerae]